MNRRYEALLFGDEWYVASRYNYGRKNAPPIWEWSFWAGPFLSRELAAEYQAHGCPRQLVMLERPIKPVIGPASKRTPAYDAWLVEKAERKELARLKAKYEH